MRSKVAMEQESEILIYQSRDGHTKVDVKVVGETVWLTLNQLAELFQKAKSTVSEHISNIFEEGELTEESTVRFFRTVQTEGGRASITDIAGKIGERKWQQFQVIRHSTFSRHYLQKKERI
jgi:hypothetical protein